MTALRPCLWLTPDQMPRALELYERLVPGFTIASRVHFDNEAQPEHSVDVIQLELAGTAVQIMSCARYSEFTEAISMYLVVDDQAQLDAVWEGFTEAGGTPVQCGWITDPFGVRWQVVPQAFHDLVEAGDQAQAQRVVEAVWSMVKIDAAALEAAARG